MSFWPGVFRSPRWQRLLPGTVLRHGSTRLLRGHVTRCRAAGTGLAVCYHNIAAPPPDNRLNMAVAPANFAAQVRQWCDVAMPAAGVPAAGEVLLTFDDAYAGVCRHALPALRTAGAPAVLFVAPWFIGRPEAFWWDALYRWLTGLPRDGAEHVFAGETVIADAAFTPSAIFDRLLPRLWRCHPGEVLAQLRAAAIDVRPDSDDWRPMTWDEVRACAAAGMRIGCHGLTHRCFTALSAAELEAELAAAEAQLARETGVCPDLLAVPYGAAGTWNGAVLQAAGRHGYRAVLLNAGDGGGADNLPVDRISVRNTPYVHPKTYERKQP